VELVGQETFRIHDHLYTTSALEVAFERLGKAQTLKRVDLFIPSVMAQQHGFSCQSYASAIIASRVEWRFYEWTPGRPETVVPTKCDFAIVG
jgi:hypothetical protein